MMQQTPVNYAQLGIEWVAVVDEVEVAYVDLMTRSRAHAELLEDALGVPAFRFARGHLLLHSFPRVPAIAARQWMEDHGVAFVVSSGGLAENGPTTWVQGGFPP
jgi:hypothetical protein